jgi:hypothetical protein
MNIGAIGGYTPVSFVNPYATSGAVHASPVQATKGVDNAQAAKGVDDAQATDTQKVAKTDPGYKCETCANRKYQDGSDENVSFKSATNIAPQAAASAVRGHEQEHVSNAYQKAETGNGKVLSATVQIHTSICPECGKTYVSGGTTRTQIKYSNEENPYQKNLKSMQGNFLRGINLDMEA